MGKRKNIQTGGGMEKVVYIGGCNTYKTFLVRRTISCPSSIKINKNLGIFCKSEEILEINLGSIDN